MPKIRLKHASPAEVLDSIETKSRELNRLATELSQRISAFEAWLNRLPGKVETEAWDGAPSCQHGEVQFGLRLQRSGKAWELAYSYAFPEDPEGPVAWKPLREAAVDEKIVAVNRFPEFLLQISSAQDHRIKDLESVHSKFDSFARAIGMTIEEGA